MKSAIPGIASSSALKKFPLCFCERFTTARMAKVVKDTMSVLSQKHNGNFLNEILEISSNRMNNAAMGLKK